MKKSLAFAILCTILLSAAALGEVSVSSANSTAAATATPANSATAAPEIESEAANETTAVEASETPSADDVEAEPLTELDRKSRGKAVKKLQERLIEKGYLSDEADGIYGSLTKSAIMLLQYQNDMEVTGIADVKLQEFLFSDECPECIKYTSLIFDTDEVDVSVCFNGRVLQVIEGKETVLRVATRGAYEDVVYITYMPAISEQSFSVGDRITVYGTTAGPFTYRNTSGNPVTLTHIIASLITAQ